MLQLRFDTHNQCFALAKIAGAKMEEIELLVDTGSRYVHLDDRKCQELRLAPIGAISIPCVHGENKSRPRYKGRIQIDDIPYAKNDIDIIGLILEEDSSEGQKPKLMGIIGRDVLFKLKLNINGVHSQGYVEQ
jgi:hypothetical protein